MATMLRRPEPPQGRVELTTHRATAIMEFSLLDYLLDSTTAAATNSTLFVVNHRATAPSRNLLLAGQLKCTCCETAKSNVPKYFEKTKGSAAVLSEVKGVSSNEKRTTALWCHLLR